jgi:uncharacterized phage-associated protein
MPNHRPEAIANAFLGKPKGLGRLTQMQVQKLVYIAHGWMLALANEALVDIEPEAWERGPVFPSLRDHIKLSGSKPIKDLIRENDDNPAAFFSDKKRGDVFVANLTEYEMSVIDHVWSRYGNMGAFRLSDLTHMPMTPWSLTYEDGIGRNDTIPNKMIQSHYRELAAVAS